MGENKAENQSNYTAKQPDANGLIAYSAEENATWKMLYERQIKIVQNRACEEYLRGLEILNLPKDHVPQCQEVSKVLSEKTGWSIVPVPALISFNDFFTLLADKQFPAASFIRTMEDIDYLKEPDIFHEIFGHCPLLTNPVFADFMWTYGKIGLKATSKERALLARLFWFTVEFGLIQTSKGLRIYGAGILSSKEETIYALESNIPVRKPFSALDVLRTPYRYDEIQKIYFVINQYQNLFDLLNTDIISLIRQAQALGEHSEAHPAHGC
jgi:phenylalanine-4-hydroxylase